eukprot:m.141084 g.141084  ORF g.141084 m.141084 type:complete len:111 (+) comp14838_c0_seq14:1101-1433(+)
MCLIIARKSKWSEVNCMIVIHSWLVYSWLVFQRFMYAARKHSSAYMLPVLMEAELRDPRTWPGPVGFELGGVLYSNLSEESELTLDGTGFQHLCSEIDSRLRLRRKSKSK